MQSSGYKARTSVSESDWQTQQGRWRPNNGKIYEDDEGDLYYGDRYYGPIEDEEIEDELIGGVNTLELAEQHGEELSEADLIPSSFLGL